MSGVPIDPIEVALAALLLVVNGALCVVLGLGLVRSLAVAALRMVVQIAIVGLVLSFVLARDSPAWTLLTGVAMVLVAGVELRGRRRGDWLQYGLGNATLLLVACVATLYAAVVVAGPSSPWHAPRTVLPILGMMLGTTLVSVGLALQALADGAARERAAIEARIAQGATRLTAFAGVLASALRTATAPLLNSMAAAGVVTLPGLMAGQILAGVEPVEAARIQIMIMLILAGAGGLGALAAALGSVLLLTDSRHRLRLERAAGPRQPITG